MTSQAKTKRCLQRWPNIKAALWNLPCLPGVDLMIPICRRASHTDTKVKPVFVLNYSPGGSVNRQRIRVSSHSWKLLLIWIQEQLVEDDSNRV